MYDSDTTTVTNALKGSNSAVFSDQTISKILALTASDNNTVRFDQVTATGGDVTVASGTGIVHVGSSATQQTQINVTQDAPVWIFEGAGGVNATINAGVAPGGSNMLERVLIHSSGADNFFIGDNWNTEIIIGANDTVTGGAGNDTVIAGSGNSTVIGGSGYTIVELAGNDSDYEVTVVDGRAVVTNTETGVTTDISNSQFVQLDDGEALVFAKDSMEAAIASLYETTFGRAADASGLKFWFDRARDGLTLEEIADAFTQVAEFEDIAERNDEEFVNALYQQTFGRDADDGGLAFWTNQLENGADRGDILEAFANLSAAQIDGSEDGETTIIGSITIVPGIV
ncbi:DUF4214 domain-containing protein [Telluria beijingensis]|uniref:DUF4214 domain-containing protein n=1 Tax=Telluria beijingensis TaxID=3068633 RepID=UPI002795F973|nr:DUF4214 domain-containing protein [Massilia sp. REN29]